MRRYHPAGRGRVLSQRLGDRPSSQEDNLRVEEGWTTCLVLALFPGREADCVHLWAGASIVSYQGITGVMLTPAAGGGLADMCFTGA